MPKHTLKSIIELYQETFLTTDTAPVALIAAILVGSRMNTAPVWLYLIGPSSGGKSALIECFNRVPFCTQVSDLTTNTFLSGFSNGKRETSLLHRLGKNFTILMKDFTTILTKSEETQAAIISQMREIYDGHITKETGTGITLEWGGKTSDTKGHATFIMASTEGIFTVQDKFADMGTRATNYILTSQDRKAVTKRSLRNSGTYSQKMENIQKVFCEFIMDKISGLPETLPYVDEKLEDELIEVADFSSICRSVVKRDYRGVKNLALSAEMPSRIANQLLTQCQLLTYINDGVLTDELKNAVFKMGIDSIPKQRRLVLEALAKYNRVTKSGIADYTNYPPDRVQEWLEDLNMFGVCNRIKAKDKQYWQLKEEYRKTMIKFLHIKQESGDLQGEDDGDNYSGGGNYSDPDLSYEAQETQVIDAENREIEFKKY